MTSPEDKQFFRTDYNSPSTVEAKIVLVGASSVGKSSLCIRFVSNSFSALIPSTLGASFLSKTIVVKSQPVKLLIWDTAGQDRYRTLGALYYRNSAAALICFDVTRPATLQQAAGWIQEVRDRSGSDPLMVLVANKIDLAGRLVSESEGRQFAEKHNCLILPQEEDSGGCC
eukprot:gnl/Dysnectes_brevis/6656_a10496_329.p1 GENE.gnl/Dysnectes_brevis/6656_a10496_329~~gnl/Dysnectes_brevis/6656_a10496_329.p1  ORF type:complete len:171 (+),score=33.23 gnl/Dysnectes_brevis/6656_a10496_329:35-547(+)